MATVSFSPAGDVLYAYLAGEIDHDAAQSLRIQLDDALVSRAPQTMILDFGGVGFMDSSGVGLILGRQRAAFQQIVQHDVGVASPVIDPQQRLYRRPSGIGSHQSFLRRPPTISSRRRKLIRDRKRAAT